MVPPTLAMVAQVAAVKATMVPPTLAMVAQVAAASATMVSTTLTTVSQLEVIATMVSTTLSLAAIVSGKEALLEVRQTKYSSTEESHQPLCERLQKPD
jgi:3-hydroxyisobutyrate dehydrogenase-like beta-hydroxyacid dehydrogenase